MLMFLSPFEPSQAGEQDNTTLTQELHASAGFGESRVYEPLLDYGLMAASTELMAVSTGFSESHVYKPIYDDGLMAVMQEDEITSAQDLDVPIGFEEIHALQPLCNDATMAVAGGDEMSISREDRTSPTPVAPIPDIAAGVEEQREIPRPSDDEPMTINQEIDVENAIRKVEPTSMAEEDNQPQLQKVVRKPRKCARKTQYDGQAQDPCRFLDIEAEVSHDEQGEGTDDEGDDDFINDASSESGEDAPFFIPDSKASLPPNNIEDGLDLHEDEWGSEEEILDWDNDPAIASHDE
ncbi:hypothetical protein H0H92_010440, partial [Tricholoma furcatifolium]